uniref:Uncharacterized protein n=1 Tax=Panagrolaimus superbus TaxID=310955 RepID=A0A914Z507_9BILA
MDLNYYLKLNDEFRDVQLSWIKNLTEMQAFISMFEEYQANNPTNDLSELKLPVSICGVKEMVRIHLDNPNEKHVFIRGNNGKYISGENGERGMRCDREVPLEWEKFIIEDVGNGKIALKSMNKYVSSENGNGAITCNRRHADAWEYFDMINNDDGSVAFKGNNGKYITSENGKKDIACYIDVMKGWEKFHIEHLPSPADEVLLSWKLFNEHFTNLYNKYDAAVTAKKNINPENYFYAKAVTVHHDGDGHYATYHQEKRFDQDSFKKDMKKVDEQCYHAKWHLNQQYHHLYCLLERENSRDETISKMYSNIYPAKTFLEAKMKKEEVVEVEIKEEEPHAIANVNLIPALGEDDDVEDDCVLVY